MPEVSLLWNNSAYILVREGFTMSKYFIIIIVNLLVFSKICTSLYIPLDVSSESDEIDWSIKIPAQEEQATHAEPEKYNYQATFLTIKEALGCEDNYVKAIISQLELAGIYGVQEACMVQDESYSALKSMNILTEDGNARRVLMTNDYVLQSILDAETLECVFFFAY